MRCVPWYHSPGLGCVSYIDNNQQHSKTAMKWNECSRCTKEKYNANKLTLQYTVVYIDDVVSRLSLYQRYFIILYADDIGLLMISLSVTKLQNIVSICERELNFLHMRINIRKSCCMPVGQRYNVKCADILSGDGTSIMWVDSIGYLLT